MMAEQIYPDELLLLAARLYYVDGLSQSDVARWINVSQAKVSRVLALARQKGIVQITVAEYDPRNHQLEAEIERRLNLRQAIVINTVPGLPPEELRRSLVHFASPWVAGLIPPRGRLAISGGRTLQWLSQEMEPPQADCGLSVVQAMGNIDSNVGPYDALELGRVVAGRWKGVFLTLNTLALLPNAEVRNQFLALEPIRRVIEHLARVDIALVGVGTLTNSVFVERGVLSSSDAEQLVRAGAVGEICGRFYDARGEECASVYRDRVVSIEMEHLRRTPEVVAVVAGSDRSEAILGAVAGGLIKSLVIDGAGAAALLERAK